MVQKKPLVTLNKGRKSKTSAVPPKFSFIIKLHFKSDTNISYPCNGGKPSKPTARKPFQLYCSRGNFTKSVSALVYSQDKHSLKDTTDIVTFSFIAFTIFVFIIRTLSLFVKQISKFLSYLHI